MRVAHVCASYGFTPSRTTGLEPATTGSTGRGGLTLHPTKMPYFQAYYQETAALSTHIKQNLSDSCFIGVIGHPSDMASDIIGHMSDAPSGKN